MNDRIFEKLTKAGDFFTAGFFKEENANISQRFFNAIVYVLKNAPLPKYDDTYLYPINAKSLLTGFDGIMFFDYAYPFTLNEENLQKSCLDEEEKKYIVDFASKTYRGGECIERRFALAGRGYTHFVPDYEFFINRGLDEFVSYVRSFDDGSDFMRGEICIAERVYDYVERIISYLKTLNQTQKTINLIKAYERFLHSAATDIFGAIVRINFIFTLDGCDNLGKLDTYLKNFKIDHFTQDVLRELFISMEKTVSWNVLLSENEEITKVILKAARGQTKPNLSLAVDDKTDDEIFTEAFKSIAVSSNPAIYSKRAYVDGLIAEGVQKTDAEKFAFGGCSETMIAGQTNCGSIDAGINCVQTLNDELHINSTYDEYGNLLSAYKARVKNYVDLICNEVNENSQKRAKCIPQPIRSLICRGCIETQKDFNDGGAKYNFSIINICSFANAVDSLYVIKKLVYDERKYTLSQIADATSKNYDGYDGLLDDIKNLPCFGNDNDEVDCIAKDLFAFICDNVKSHVLNRGENGKFLPACIMFDTVSITGKITDCSPDGRKCGCAISDSGGAMTGKDVTSPTALLNSVAKINPSLALGTWIVNMRLSSGLLTGENRRNSLKGLILTYFKNGGNQLQITATDRQTLIRALDDEQLAYSIIVRVGGFSARFSTLSREIKQNIIDRSVY